MVQCKNERLTLELSSATCICLSISKKYLAEDRKETLPELYTRASHVETAEFLL